MSSSYSVNPLTLWQKGRLAIAEVPGLKRRVAYGFLLNILLYALVAISSIVAYYTLVHQRLLAYLTDHAPLWLTALSNVLLLLLLLLVSLVMIFLSLRISLKLMILWYEDLVARVVDHVHGKQDDGFSLKGLLQSIGYTLKDIARETVLAVCLFIIGLIPVLGPVLVFFGASHLMGRAVMEPYRCVMRDRGVKLKNGSSVSETLRLGWTSMVLALIPFIGWLVLPVFLMHNVIGYAWQVSHFAKSSAESGTN